MAAASTAVRSLLLGPRRPLRVVAAGPRAVYLADAAHDDPVADGPAVAARPVLALLAPDAVRVPFGVVLDGSVPRPAVRVGDEAVAGEGGLRLTGLDVRPLRWWDPAVPVVHLVAGRAAAALARHLPPLPDEVVEQVPALEAALAAAAGSPDPGVGLLGVAATVRALVGRGPGLTPAGDDVLAGALCALAAVRQEMLRDRLVRCVLADAHRTTPVSAALLAQAASGHAVPALSAVLRALAGPPQRVPGAVAALLAVGHTSGTALGHGLVVALRASTSGRVAA